MKVKLNQAEYRAIHDLRGLPDRAHLMVMSSRSTETGGELEGSKAELAELVSFISGEMAEGMLSATDAGILGAACVKIDPSCARWLGM